MSDRGADDVELVIAAQAGDGDAFTDLYDRWFDRVYDVSRRVLRDPELAAEVTQDVFLVTWRQLDTLRRPGSFGGWLLRASRNRSLNRLERERRSVAMGDEETVMEIDHQAVSSGTSGDQPVVEFEAAEQEAMVWAAAAALGDRDASILHLHLRHGLDGADLAEELDVTANAANQAMFRLRTRLGGAIRAWVLWRHGHPVCEQLDEVLTTAGISQFGAPAVRAIDAHAEDCDRCSRHRAVLVAPEALFAAVPIIAAPVGLKARVAGALEAEGVPISSSRAPDGSAGSAASSFPPPTPATSVFAAVAADDSGGDQTVVADVASPPPTDHRSRRRAAMVAVLLALIVGGGILTWILGSDDDAPGLATATTAPSDATTTSDQTTSTTEPATTTSTEETTTTSSTTTTSTTSTTQPPQPPPPPAPPPTPDPTPPPPAPPTVTSFVADRAGWADLPPGERCPSPSEHVRLVWSTADADSVSITGPGDPGSGLGASGETFACSIGGGDYTLVASGPGGASDPAVRTVAPG